MNLQEFFKENPKVALAFSGGVDSSYLLYAAMKYGADVKAYYVKALFQPQFEMDDAMRLADQLKAPVRVLRADVLSDPVVVSNPSNRWRPSGHEGIAGAAGKISAERMRSCKIRDPQTFQRRRAFYLGQAVICMSGHPHSDRMRDYGRKASEDGSSRGFSVLPWIQ